MNLFQDICNSPSFHHGTHCPCAPLVQVTQRCLATTHCRRYRCHLWSWDEYPQYMETWKIMKNVPNHQADTMILMNHLSSWSMWISCIAISLFRTRWRFLIVSAWLPWPICLGLLPHISWFLSTSAQLSVRHGKDSMKCITNIDQPKIQGQTISNL